MKTAILSSRRRPRSSSSSSSSTSTSSSSGYEESNQGRVVDDNDNYTEHQLPTTNCNDFNTNGDDGYCSSLACEKQSDRGDGNDIDNDQEPTTMHTTQRLMRGRRSLYANSRNGDNNDSTTHGITSLSKTIAEMGNGFDDDDQDRNGDYVQMNEMVIQYDHDIGEEYLTAANLSDGPSKIVSTDEDFNDPRGSSSSTGNRQRRHRRRSGISLPGGSLHSASSLDSSLSGNGLSMMLTSDSWHSVSANSSFVSSSSSVNTDNFEIDDDDDDDQDCEKRQHIPQQNQYQQHPSLVAMNASAAQFLCTDFDQFVRKQNAKDWLIEFKRSDPRHKILNFFNDVAQLGGNGSINKSSSNKNNSDNVTSSSKDDEATDSHDDSDDSSHLLEEFDTNRTVSPLLRAFYRSSVFTVWRPCSKDAIRLMMLGEGVGKGRTVLMKRRLNKL